jgi:carbonic anhydrase
MKAEGKYHGTSAAIEFAVRELKVPHLIVLGHSRCGGIAAYRQTAKEQLVPEQGFVGGWLALLDDVKVIESDVAFGNEVAFEFAAIRSSLTNLRTFPFLREREEDGLLDLHGLHFDLATGQVVVITTISSSSTTTWMLMVLVFMQNLPSRIYHWPRGPPCLCCKGLKKRKGGSGALLITFLPERSR